MQMYAIQSFTICCFNNLIKLSLKRYSRKLKQMPTYAKWESQRLNMPDCLSEFWLKVNYCLQKVLSMSLYQDFIQITSRFYPRFILIFLGNSIFIWIFEKIWIKLFFQILSRCNPYFILIFRESLHPNFIIWIKSAYMDMDGPKSYCFAICT